jgi:hypothetical protein
MVKSFLALAIETSLFHTFDQFHRAGGRAHLAFMDHIGEHVTRHLFRLGRIDARQIVRLAAAGPQLQPLRPGIELLRRIAGLDIVIALLQQRVNEISGDVGNGGLATVFGKHHRSF